MRANNLTYQGGRNEPSSPVKLKSYMAYQIIRKSFPTYARKKFRQQHRNKSPKIDTNSEAQMDSSSGLDNGILLD